MIEILLKFKADAAKKYLEYLKKKENINIDNNVKIEKDASKHITTAQEIQSKTDNRKFIDNGSNEIIYNNKRILFFEYKDILYFKGKDVFKVASASTLLYLSHTSIGIFSNKFSDKEGMSEQASELVASR